jgi:hypothetical protein
MEHIIRTGASNMSRMFMQMTCVNVLYLIEAMPLPVLVEAISFVCLTVTCGEGDGGGVGLRKKSFRFKMLTQFFSWPGCDTITTRR